MQPIPRLVLMSLLVLSLSVMGFSQSYQKDTKAITELNSQLMRYKKSFLEDDVETGIAMTHPEMRAKLGGPDKMRASFQRGKKIREEHEMTYAGMDYVLPDSVLVTANSHQAAFPVGITVRYKDGSVEKDSRVLIAYEDDATKTWYFLSIPPTDLDRVKASLRFVDPGLKIQ